MKRYIKSSADTIKVPPKKYKHHWIEFDPEDGGWYDVYDSETEEIIKSFRSYGDAERFTDTLER